MTNLSFRRALLTSTLLIAAGSTSALAQTAQEEAAETPETPTVSTDQVIMDTIVVTGSRIARPEVEQPAPMIGTFTGEELRNRSFTNVSQALNEIPGFGTPVSSNGGQSGFSVGQNFVNLFGIGSQRTLTLVNGRRFVSSNTASNFSGAAAGLQVDLNVIPTSLIERVEPLTLRGATTYGSDAIAGTVNLILQDDFEGLEVNGQLGVYEEGDGESTFASATMGTNFDDDRGNIVFNFEFNSEAGILSSRRALLREGVFRSNANTILFDRRISALTRGGIPTRAGGGGGGLTAFGGGFNDADGNIVQFDSNGNLVPFDIGETAGAVNTEGGDGLTLVDAGQITTDIERYTAYTLGHYDVTDNITAYFEANYARTESEELANQPVYQSALFGGDSGGLGVLLSNPFLNDQARAVLSLDGNLDGDGDGMADLNFDTDGDDVDDDTRFFLQRAGFDLLGGRNPNFGQLELFRIVGGVRGDFEIGDRQFNWDVSYNYGESQAVATSTSLVQANFLNAVDVVDQGLFEDGVANGNIVCRVAVDPPENPGGGVPGTPAGTNAVDGCVPLNLFGDGAPSAEAIDFVTTLTSSVSTNRQNIFNANLGGELFELFGNAWLFNVGYEGRKERQSFTPDGFLQEGLGRSVAIAPVTGSFTTNEFFGELIVPIIQPSDGRFIDLLEFDASVRYIDNSRAGSDTIYSVGGQIGPIRDLRIRGSYTESVRAPAITELFLPAVSIFSFADDPCDQDFIDAGSNPATRAANCAADGITQPFSSTIEDASQQITSSGNPGLLNETSKSWTAGIVLEPRFVPGLTITADWINIELTNAIVSTNLTDILRSCYDNSNFPNASTCQQFTRGADGQITGANVGFSNAGSFDFAGLQARVNYGFDIANTFGSNGDLGALDFRVGYFYLDKSERTIAGVLDDDRGEIGDFKHEANGTVTYSLGGTSLSATGTYLSSAVFDLEDPADSEFRGVGDYFVVDSTISHTVNDMLSLRFTVNNVFEEEPPFPSRSTTQYTSGVLGRQYLVGVQANF
ncbi:MAG: TonB-dependent receptor [Pacificimonas sp.]